MERKLPTYRIVINPEDESGVYAVSLVDQPAIEVDWIKLSKEVIEFEFSANKDKQLLNGPLLIPNKLIYRRDDNGNEYNIVFDEETIQLIADKYNENKLGDIFNFQHSDKTVEAVLLQNWITGEIDKSQEYGFTLAKGTWFGSVKVKDEEFWLSEVKTGKVKGFSVEIKAGVELIEMNEQKIKNINLMEIKTNEGVSLYFDGEFAVGTALFLDEAKTQKAPEGAHMLEDERVITLDAEGVILSIADKTPEIETEEEMAEEVVVEQPVDEKPNEDMKAMIVEIVTPLMDEVFKQNAELLSRVSQLEDKINGMDNNELNEELSSIKEKVELLSKADGVQSITSTKTDSDVKPSKDEVMLARISSLRDLR